MESLPSGPALAGKREFHIEGLLEPGSYPHMVSHLQLKQTHISWVVLTGHFAYKIKKPVRYDFIDASTLEKRRALCLEELRLNRRFAPDLYVDVVPVTCEGARLRVCGQGEPLEYAVRMHEFDPTQELASQLTQGNVTPRDLREFAARLADQHLRAPVATPQTPHGTSQRVRERMLENFAPLRAYCGGALELQRVDRLAEWTEESLARLEPLIESRKRAGMVRECHGDLHARNIVRWRQQWLPFDCLEFDADLRWIDVVSDVAFLFMDLASRGREDLAYEFLSRYLEETGDYAGLRLLPLYGAYRALVRAKVDALGAETAGHDQRKALEKRLAERLAIAIRFIETETLNVVIMHGVTASGKSWLSERLVCAIHAIRIRSDLERKRLPGETAEAPGTAGVGEGRYSRASIQQTYERLLECSESALEGGCNVIVDATFLQAAHRELFRSMAQRHNARFLIVSCATDPATLEERLAMRARSALDPSEATHAVLHEQLRSQQPLSAGELANAVEVDTRRMTSAEAGIRMVRTRLPLPAIA
jgi:hypothetical protein